MAAKLSFVAAVVLAAFAVESNEVTVHLFIVALDGLFILACISIEVLELSSNKFSVTASSSLSSLYSVF